MEVIQLDWKLRYTPGDFSRRVTVRRAVGTVLIVIGLKIRQLSLRVDSVPE